MIKYLIKLFNKFFADDYIIIPVIPPEELLISMALRDDHAFLMSSGMSDNEIEKYKKEHPIMAGQFYTSPERQCMLSRMNKLHEEVTGRGFFTYWKKENNDRYRIVKK